MKFTIHSEGIALDAETIIDLQRFEVQAQCAVVLTRHGDVLAVEHLRVALHALVVFFCFSPKIAPETFGFLDIFLYLRNEKLTLFIHL